jgi:hypothetical protein
MGDMGKEDSVQSCSTHFLRPLDVVLVATLRAQTRELISIERYTCQTYSSILCNASN